MTDINFPKLNFEDPLPPLGEKAISTISAMAKNMIGKGVNHFIEIGPGKVLSGLIKRIDKNVKINTINNESDIKDLKI